jgi:hypothetical protein
MNRKSTYFHSFVVLGILVSWVSRVAATPVTYSSLSMEQNNDPNDPSLTNYSTEVADHMADVSAAAPVVTNFLGSLGSYGTETYDGVNSPAAGTNGTLYFVPTGITASNSFYQVEAVPPDSYSYSGNSLLGIIGETPNTFYLSSPVTAFGTYIDQAGDADADTLSLLLQNTNNSFSETVPIGVVGPDADEFNIFYFGVTDANNPFNEVTLQGGNAVDGDSFIDGVLLDNTTVGFAAVPEPSSLVLVCGGLLSGLVAIFVRRTSAHCRMETLPCGSC